MFEIGSYVSYRAEGVCVIRDIRAERFGSIGSSAKYYILSPLNDEKSTVFVPADNEVLMRYMRPLLSPEEIMELIAQLRDKRIEWIPESRARNARYRDILADGDRRILIAMIYTIEDYVVSIHPKKPGNTDENAFRRAIRMLFEEFSMTTDLSNIEELIAVLHGERLLRPKQ